MISKLPNYHDIIKSTILKYLSPLEYDVFLFGSRAKGTQKKWSDYDVGVKSKTGQPIPPQVRYNIELELDRLNVPFIVDLVDFSQVENKFKQIAMQSYQLWTK